MDEQLEKSKRLDLQNLLVDLLGKNNVYFQPPASIRLSYPCIIYEMDGMDVRHAGSVKYKTTRRYTVTLIDPNPDSEFPFKLLQLEYCSFNRFFTSDNLNHYVFTLYF